MNYTIRKIEVHDNEALELIIKTTMKEFGANGPGFSINDLEVSSMAQNYTKIYHAYFVITVGQKICGGAGVAPLSADERTICELRKMYFLPELRGKGAGQLLIEACLDEARILGFSKCYLETLKSMKSAQKLYVKNGFVEIPAPLGDTGHFGCDCFYLKELR